MTFDNLIDIDSAQPMPLPQAQQFTDINDLLDINPVEVQQLP